MSRAAQFFTSKITIAAIVVVIAAGAGGLAYETSLPHATKVENPSHQLTQLSYAGQTGKSAMTLLKKFATVQVKRYSFGDFVTSINGVSGNGPKYWTLYVNNKEASVGADAYITKNSDTVTWKLQ